MHVWCMCMRCICVHVRPRVARHVSAGEVATYVADNLVILQTIDEQKCDTKYNMQKDLFLQARGHLFQIRFDKLELHLSAWQFRHHWVHDFDFSCFYTRVCNGSERAEVLIQLTHGSCKNVDTNNGWRAQMD